MADLDAAKAVDVTSVNPMVDTEPTPSPTGPRRRLARATPTPRYNAGACALVWWLDPAVLSELTPRLYCVCVCVRVYVCVCVVCVWLSLQAVSLAVCSLLSLS